MTQLPIFREDLLYKAFNGDITLVKAFQQLLNYVTVAANEAGAGAAVSEVLSAASVLTLSAVSGWNGARVLSAGDGVSFNDDGSRVTVRLSDLTPKINGGFPVTFLVTGATNLILPLIGTVATLADIAAAISGTVTSFNTRTGAVTLTSGDVTGALGFTPYSAANPSGYISGITSGMVTTALGYTPTSITGSTGAQTATQITAALNVFTSTLKGLAPSSGGGTANYLRADGTWAAPPGATSGTVTSVSVVTANGVSGSVANPTTTPAITLTLGAITPTTVTASSTVAGTNITTGGDTIGNSATTTKWATARTIGITGDATWSSGSLDGSANVTAAITLATVNPNIGSFGSATQVATFTVNAKGLTTAASNVTITPAVGSITGLGSGVATALAINVASAGALVTFNGALGTPSSGSAANLTSFPTLNQNTTGSAATLTTPRNIAGNPFDGSSAISILDTDLSGVAWTAFTPTLTPGGGSFTTATATGGYKKIGKTVFFRMKITITTAGTASSYINASLPTTPANVSCDQAVLGYEEGLSNNVAVTGKINNNLALVTIFKYDGTTIIASGAVIILTGCYETT